MILRRITLNDYEEIVDMYYNFMIEVFGDKRQITPKYFYYKLVIDWINSSKHIVVATKDDKVLGFTLSYIDTNSNLTEPIYNGEIAYVKKEYRNTKAGYMLYKNVVNVAKELNMNLVANGRICNGIDKMIEKHFKPEAMFINYEKEK